jgi:O-antigen/teichoic acid export membrane protein
VSILLPVESLAVYNLAKRIEEIGRISVEGFFDPMIQKIVKYKNNINEIIKYKKKLYLTKNFFIIITFLCVIAFNYYANTVVSILNLKKYENLDIYLIIASWTPIIYLFYKVHLDIIYLFDDQKILFKMDVFRGALSIITFYLFSKFVDLKYIYFNRVFTGVVMAIFFIYYYNRHFSFNNKGVL